MVRCCGCARFPGSFFSPFQSLEIDFSIKSLLSPLIQPMGPFCMSGGPFALSELVTKYNALFVGHVIYI